ESEFRLVVAQLRNTGRVDLGKARVTEKCTLLIAAPSSGHIRILRICRQEVDVAVSTGTQQDSIGGVALDFAIEEVSCNYALRLAVNRHQVDHFAACKHLDGAKVHLTHQCRIS